jgi:hypothetical protein
MSARVAWLAIPFALILLGEPSAMAASQNTDAESRVAEESALRAQIRLMDHDLQSLESQLYQLDKEHADDPSRADKKRALREQIHQMDHQQELLENRLRALEKDDSPAMQEARRQAKPAAQAGEETASPPAPAPVQMAAPAPPPPPPQLGPTLRQAADPAPYEKAAGNRVGMFRYNPYRWVPVGTRQLAVYNTYDEAYLLDFANDCPSLLSADRIKIENFSTKVVVNRDAVIADGQRCLITGIRELNVSRLPR